MGEVKVSLVSVLCLFAWPICNIYSTNVSQCREDRKNPPFPVQVSITNCNDLPCVYKRGNRVWINMTFTSDDVYKKLKHNVYATVYWKKYAYPHLNGTDVCPFLTPKVPVDDSGCTLQPGITYSYAMEILVEPSTPIITVSIHYAIKDEDENKEIACFELIIRIIK